MDIAQCICAIGTILWSSKQHKKKMLWCYFCLFLTIFVIWTPVARYKNIKYSILPFSPPDVLLYLDSVPVNAWSLQFSQRGGHLFEHSMGVTQTELLICNRLICGDRAEQQQLWNKHNDLQTGNLGSWTVSFANLCDLHIAQQKEVWRSGGWVGGNTFWDQNRTSHIKTAQ